MSGKGIFHDDEFKKVVDAFAGTEFGVITVDEFKKAVDVFGFNSPVVTAVWNVMHDNPYNADEFETVYALWQTGRFNDDIVRKVI